MNRRWANSLLAAPLPATTTPTILRSLGVSVAMRAASGSALGTGAGAISSPSMARISAGAMHSSPAWTLRMASSTTSAGSSLPTTPRAPPRTACPSSDWSRLPLNISTRALPSASSWGRMSIELAPSRSRSSTMMSGRSSAAVRTAPALSLAVPTSTMAGCSPSISFSRPHNMVLWSSTSMTRIGAVVACIALLEGNGDAHGRGLAAAFDVDGAAQRHRAFGQRGRQEAVGRAVGVVVFDADAQLAVGAAQHHPPAARARVLADIAHAFVDDLEHLGGQAVADDQSGVGLDGDGDAVELQHLGGLAAQGHQQFRFLAVGAAAHVAGEVAHVADDLAGHG